MSASVRAVVASAILLMLALSGCWLAQRGVLLYQTQGSLSLSWRVGLVLSNRLERYLVFLAVLLPAGAALSAWRSRASQ